MTRDRAELCLALIVTLAFAGLGPASAGGVNFGDDTDNPAEQGPYFFGFVRDAAGSAVADAKVTASVKTGALVTRTNGMGVYKIPGFGKDINPDSVAISCAKDGYKEASVLRRPHAAGDNTDPVEVECTLQKE